MAALIENELKYVLRGHAALETMLARMAPSELLRAGYLSPESRIRREGLPGDEAHVFTFKRRLANGRNLEIPKHIDPETFDLLWGETIERLAKRRYSLRDGAVRWDTDFFVGAGGAVYFAMAEVEMPAEMEEPERLLPLIAPHVAFVVPRDDARFTSRLLANEAYARALARDLGAEA